MTIEMLEIIIAVGVWLELAVGVFSAWMAWKMLQVKVKTQLSRRFTKLIKKVGITVILMYLVIPNSYGQAFAQWGIVSDYPGEHNRDAVKFVEFGASGLHKRLAYTVGVGGWIDNTHYGREKTPAPVQNTVTLPKNPSASSEARSSGFVEALFGVEPRSEHMYIGYKLGPAIITHPDALLGSHLQCSHEFGIGMLDKSGVKVGFVIKHFSNAGLIKPNLGRDFVGMRIEF